MDETNPRSGAVCTRDTRMYIYIFVYAAYEYMVRCVVSDLYTEINSLCDSSPIRSDHNTVSILGINVARARAPRFLHLSADISRTRILKLKFPFSTACCLPIGRCVGRSVGRDYTSFRELMTENTKT